MIMLCTNEGALLLLFAGASGSQPVPAPIMTDLLRTTDKDDFDSFVCDLKEAFTDDVIDSVEKSTRMQSSSREWHLHRRARVTSTVCHAFKTTATRVEKEPGPHDMTSLLNAVSCMSSFQTPSMKRGKSMESEAAAFYMTLLIADGHQPVLENRGFIIWKDFPVMGCSPDGVVSYDCECCLEKLTLLEVKCPDNIKNSFSGCRPKPVYMTQIQNAMGIFNIPSCHFFVYKSPEDWRQVTVDFDAKHFDTCVRAVHTLYSNYLFLSLRSSLQNMGRSFAA